MALISMCVFDTVENKRTEYTEKTIKNVTDTVDFGKHRMIIVDNNSCEETKLLLKDYGHMVKVITLPENIGTAKGINEAWKHRTPGENAVKMDNDVFIHQDNWLDRMEEAIARDPGIGIVGLKRNDLDEYPGNPIKWYDSKLYFLPHKPDETWIPFEEITNLMGTCQLYSSALLEKIGFLTQPGLYGFDDSLASLRSRLSGFKVGFLPHIHIDHIDRGDTPYTEEKQDMAGRAMAEFNSMCAKYHSQELNIYYDGE